MEALAKLERLQTQLLQRISNLESSVLSQHFSQNLSMKIAFPAFFANDFNDFSFKRVPSEYYEFLVEAHRYIVSAASIHHLCKSIVLVNTQAPSNITDCSYRSNSKYYVVIIQYAVRFNVEGVKNFLYTLNDGKDS